jgi:hypothetical protein
MHTLRIPLSNRYTKIPFESLRREFTKVCLFKNITIIVAW